MMITQDLKEKSSGFIVLFSLDNKYPVEVFLDGLT